MTPPRWFLVGTDTEIGKTHVACALLRHAAARELRMLPQKPAASGEPPATGDPGRLLEATALDVSLDDICPLVFERPLAPGVAAHPGRFGANPPPRHADPSRAPVDLARLEALEGRVASAGTLIEGAGGLWVPMPGPSWLPDWLLAYGARPIVVARLGLGTINHTLLTIDALERLGTPAIGVIFNESVPRHADPSAPDNAAIVRAASNTPILGQIRHGSSQLEATPILEQLVYLPMQKFEKIAESTSSPTAPIR